MNHPDQSGRCAEIQELVWLAIDDELSAEERRRLDLHVASCADCRNKIDASRRVAAGLKRLPAAAVPEGFKTATLARLEGGAASREEPGTLLSPRSWRAWGWKSLAAAASLVALASIWWISQREGGEAPGEDLSREQIASAPRSELVPADGLTELKKVEEPQSPPALQDAPAPVLSAAEEAAAPKPDAAEVDGAKQQLEEGTRQRSADERKDQDDGEAQDEVRRLDDGRSAGLPPGAAGGARDQESWSETKLRAAATPDETLREVLARVDQLRAERAKEVGALAQAEKKSDSKTEKSGEESKDKLKESRKEPAASSDKSEKNEKAEKTDPPSPPVVFYIVPSDASFVSKWLANLSDEARDYDVVVVDVTMPDYLGFSSAVRDAELYTARVEADAWLARVADQPADAAGARGPVTAKNAGKMRGAPAAAPSPKITGGFAKSDEPQRIRLVLWLAPKR